MNQQMCLLVWVEKQSWGGGRVVVRRKNKMLMQFPGKRKFCTICSRAGLCQLGSCWVWDSVLFNKFRQPPPWAGAVGSRACWARSAHDHWLGSLQPPPGSSDWKGLQGTTCVTFLGRVLQAEVRPGIATATLLQRTLGVELTQSTQIITEKSSYIPDQPAQMTSSDTWAVNSFQ